MENSELKEKSVSTTEENGINTILKKIDQVKKTAKDVENIILEVEKIPGVKEIKKRIKGIKIGNDVTILCGDLEKQNVRSGQIISIIEKGITIIDSVDNVDGELIPILIQYKDIIDIFETAKIRKQKEAFSLFKLNKKIYEFFNGSEEEIKHAYEQKISVKQLRDQLKNKNK